MPYLKHKPKSLESAVSKIQENEYEKVFRKALKKYNVDSPKELDKEKKKKFFKYKTEKGKKRPLGFRYDSLTNKHFLTVSNIQKLIAQHLKFPKK